MSTFNKLASTFILAVATFGIGNVIGCTADETTHEGEVLGEADLALTAAQCEYFDVNGTVQICHSLGNGKFKILKLSDQGCINGHTSHPADYVAVGDPTCQGNGCLPENAPCDATLPCCDGATCTNGVCVATVTDPCASNPCPAPSECVNLGGGAYECFLNYH